MATKSQSLELTIRNAKAVKGEILVTRCGAGLEMWVSVNQSGKTLKKWVLRYTDAAGKRQKVRIGSYPEMTLAKAQAAAEDLKEKAKIERIRQSGNIRSIVCNDLGRQDFLKLEAENGNKTALAVLRSRKEVTEPEQLQEQKPPVKNWMERGSEYAVKTTIRAEYAEKERKLQERDDISHKGKKQLLAFLHMEQITAEARAEGMELGEIKRRIDNNGIVIFTLESGGTIRDTGKEIFFSSHDPKAERAALLYAGKKWGKRLVVEKGHIMFQAERHIERKAPEFEKKRRGLSR